jgi:hypothetical protein
MPDKDINLMCIVDVFLIVWKTWMGRQTQASAMYPIQQEKESWAVVCIRLRTTGAALADDDTA